MFENWARRRTNKRIALHLRATKTEIHPLPIRGMFNQRCHSNAVQYQSENGGEVIECIYLEDGEPILHYVNKDERGDYLETTLGVFCKGYEYYAIRTVDPSEYQTIVTSFRRGLDYWKINFATALERLFLERVV